MNDLIRRSEVWKAFISRVDSICDLEDVREILDSIPTIEERKEGRWTNVSFSIGKCSECGFSGGNCYVMKYCPNCGAKMKGE